MKCAGDHVADWDSDEGNGPEENTLNRAKHRAGTSNVEHFKDQCQYDKVDMTRAEWYDIYKAAGNVTTL